MNKFFVKKTSFYFITGAPGRSIIIYFKNGKEETIKMKKTLDDDFIKNVLSAPIMCLTLNENVRIDREHPNLPVEIEESDIIAYK